MARHVQLNPADHSGLRVQAGHGAGLGDNVMHAPVFPHEFRQLQAHYPIVFIEDCASGQLRPVALFGLETGDNLFLAGARWDAGYVPLAMRMKPFLIGRSDAGVKVHIDLDHPRVSQTSGESLFLEGGGRSPFLDEMAGLLAQVHEAEQAIAGFSAMLRELALTEPFTLDVTLDSGEQGRLSGYHTIAEERLHTLEGETLGRLQASGFLQPVFMAVASLSRFEALIARRNARAQES